MGLTRPTARQINTVISSISDPLTVLNEGAIAAGTDIGLILNRGGAGNVAMVWQESSGQFILATTTSSGVTNANITVGSYANLQAGYFIGDGSRLTNIGAYGNAQVGQYLPTYTGLLTGSTITTSNLVGNSNITVTGSILPSANETYDLGSTTARFRTGYFAAGTIDLGGSTISIDPTNGFTFAAPGFTTVTLGGSGSLTSTIIAANTAMKGYVDAQDTAISNSVTGANAAIVTANTAMKGYVDAQITSLVGGAPAVLDTLNEIAIALGNDTNLSVTLTNSITGANSAIVTANTAMKGYVDAQDTTISNSVTGANAAIVTANTAMKGYVDSAIASLPPEYADSDVSVYLSGGTLSSLVVSGAVSSSSLTVTGNVIQGTVPVLTSSSVTTGIGTTATALDTFATASYRSAKYVISINDITNTQFQTCEIILVQDGTTATISTYGSVWSGTSDRMNFTASIASGTLTLYGAGISANNTVKLVRTLIPV